MNTITERKSALAAAAAKLDQDCLAVATGYLEAVRPQASEELHMELLPYVTDQVKDNPELGAADVVAAALEDLLDMPSDSDDNADIWRVAQLIEHEDTKLRSQLLWWSRLDAIAKQYTLDTQFGGDKQYQIEGELFDGSTVRDAIEHAKNPRNEIDDHCMVLISVQDGRHFLETAGSLDEAKDVFTQGLDQEHSWSPVTLVDLQSGVEWTPKISIEFR